MIKLNKEIVEYYITAHKNIWGYITSEIRNGSIEWLYILKQDACERYGYRFQCDCALCEFMVGIQCDCTICSLITGIPHRIYVCLGGLYSDISKAPVDNKPLRLELANKILHCVDNWEENCKKEGLI